MDFNGLIASPACIHNFVEWWRKQIAWLKFGDFASQVLIWIYWIFLRHVNHKESVGGYLSQLLPLCVSSL